MTEVDRVESARRFLNSWREECVEDDQPRVALQIERALDVLGSTEGAPKALKTCLPTRLGFKNYAALDTAGQVLATRIHSALILMKLYRKQQTMTGAELRLHEMLDDTLTGGTKI